jgi:hypothetical protein
MVVHVDLSLFSLVIFLNIVGVWLARWKEKWMVPITVYLLILSLALTVGWGALIGEGFVTYGITNGIVAWVTCTALYDVVHESFVKRKDAWSGLFARLFKKKEKKV